MFFIIVCVRQNIPEKPFPGSWRLLTSADSLCKQFGPRSGPTRRRSISRPELFDSMIVFLNNLKSLILKKKSADDNKNITPSMQRVK